MRRFLPSLLGLMLVGSLASAGEKDAHKLAQQVKGILQTACYRCHGEMGSVEGGFNFVLDRGQLVARKRIAPGEPAKSKLFKRILSGEMPPEDESTRLSERDVELIKEWIAAGAPDFNPAAAKRDFIPQTKVVAAILDDLRKLPERDQRFTRYFTITHLYNAGLSEDELQTYRHALSKLVNSLSWGKHIVVPKAVDAAETIHRIDLRDYQWTESTWEQLLKQYPYPWLTGSVDERFCHQLSQTQLPHVRGDWFVATAANPPLYHDILQIPLTDNALEKELRVNTTTNLRTERAVRAGFNSSGVSRNNRLIERHETAFGAYWKSYDFGGNAGKQNLFAQPLGPTIVHGLKSFQHDGGEIIFNLPNGLQAYMLADGKGKRIDKGPTEIVSDPRRPDRAVVNGLSCMSCHARGIIPKEDQVRPHVEKNGSAFTKTELDMIRALYPPQDKLTALMVEDAERFLKAVELTGGKAGATEPIVALALRFEAEMGLELAAAEVGLTPDALSKELQDSPALTRILGPLRVEGGTVQRQVFTEAFRDLVRDLRLGTTLALVTPTKRIWTEPPPLVAPSWKKSMLPIRSTPTLPKTVVLPTIPKDTPKNKPLPSMVVQRDKKVVDFPNHQGIQLRAVAFSPTENLIASESNLGLVVLWDPATAQVRTELKGPSATVMSLSFSPDGKLLAVGGLKAVAIWDVNQRREIKSLPGHLSFVSAVQFSPDGKTVASGNEKLRLWKVETGEELLALPSLKEWIDSLAFSPDGKIIATGSKSVRLWDTTTGQELANFNDHQGPILSVAFSPDGTLLASGSSDRTILIWDVATRKAIKILKGHRDPLSSVAFHPSGKLLLSAAGGIRFSPGNLGEVKLWDLTTGAEHATLSGHTKAVSCVAVSPDGRIAASAGWDRTIRLWDLPPRP